MGPLRRRDDLDARSADGRGLVAWQRHRHARRMRTPRRRRARGGRGGGARRRSRALVAGLRARPAPRDGDAPSPDDTQPVVDAALAFVAATPSPLCLPPIEDLLGREEQPNLPGTIDEHPNWRRRLTAEADALLDEPRTAARVAQLAARRPRL